jgi:hypothetical protein
VSPTPTPEAPLRFFTQSNRRQQRAREVKRLSPQNLRFRHRKCTGNSRMRSAIHLAAGTRLHQVAAVALALLVLAFALQPCFAAVPPAHPCCPTPTPNCHEKSNPEVCAMSHTGFAAPEESSGPNSIQAEVVPVAAFEPPAPLTNAVPRPAPVRLRPAPFLLNSVLLI